MLVVMVVLVVVVVVMLVVLVAPRRSRERTRPSSFSWMGRWLLVEGEGEWDGERQRH